MSNITPINNHLIVAFWTWAEENGFRTHVRFARHAVGVVWHPSRTEPADILSISSRATKNLFITPDGIFCRTRIMGLEMDVFLPLASIDYVFSPDTDVIAIPLIPMLSQAAVQAPEQPASKPRSHLSVVK